MSMYLEPSRYDQIESQVIRLFSNINVNHFPIDCFALCKQLCVKVIPYSKLNEKTIAAFGNENKDGISVEMEIAQGVFEWTIYYNDEMPKRRIRFTIMHELGHIWLDHTEHSELAEAEAEGRKGISELLAVDDDIYAEFVNNKYDSATDWINQINDSRLREALQKLSLYQRNLVCS